MNSLGEILLRLLEGHSVEPLLVGLAKVDGNLFDRCGDQEQLRADLLGKQGGGKVLVDDRGDTFVLAIALIDNRDAAAAHGDDGHAGIDQQLDRFQLEDLPGHRGSDNPPPAAPGILHNRPAHLPFASLCFGFIHERPDRLGRLLEGRIALVHQGLCNDGRCALLDATTVILILKCLLELVADGTLRVCAAHIQRDLVHALHLGGDLRAAQDEANLRPVTVADGQVPAGFDHIGDVVGGLAQGLLLSLHADTLFIFDQGVATDGDDSEF